MATSEANANGHHLVNDIFKPIFLYENCCDLIQYSLQFAPESSIDNRPALVQMLAWHQTGDQPLPTQMMAYSTDAYISHSASMS